MKIAVIGGTGPGGFGVAARLARAGHVIAIGSRSVDRAEAAADKVRAAAPDATVIAGTNEDVIRDAEVVFLTVRDDAQRETVRQLGENMAGKVVVSMANPLRVGNGTARYVDPPEGSLAEEVQRDAPDSHVVSALHEIDVRKLGKIDRALDADTLVCGDSDRAKKTAMGLLTELGVRPVDAGPLANSRYIESFVAVLITINFRYKASTGLRITGLPD
jgi:8-hydroxy-5-deazaflavin:NADPH oxidoreductase